MKQIVILSLIISFLFLSCKPESQNGFVSYGEINNELDSITKLNSHFLEAYPFENGLAAVKNHLGLWGFINTKGTYVVEPRFLDVLSDFNEGLAGVKDKSGLWGFIDKKGKYIIEPKFNNVSDFYNDMAAAADQNTGLYGYINKKGKFIIQPKFQKAYPFISSIAPVKDNSLKFEHLHKSIGLFGYINMSGDYVIKPLHKYGLNCYDDVAIIFDGMRLSLVDCSNQEILDLKHSITIGNREPEFSEGLLAVKNDLGKWGFIDKYGKYIIEPTYKYVGDFKNGLAFAITNHNIEGYINKSGKYVIKTKNTRGLGIGNFSDNFAIFSDQSSFKKGYIDKTGKVVIKPKFDMVNDFKNGYAAVSDFDTKKWGIINKKGEYVAKPQFNNIKSFSDGLFLIETEDDKYAFVNAKGELLIIKAKN